jgi:hypothetical protein
VVDSLQDISAAKCHIYPKEKAFFQLAECFCAADNPELIKQLGDQLGRFVFGK